MAFAEHNSTFRSSRSFFIAITYKIVKITTKMFTKNYEIHRRRRRMWTQRLSVQISGCYRSVVGPCKHTEIHVRRAVLNADAVGCSFLWDKKGCNTCSFDNSVKTFSMFQLKAIREMKCERKWFRPNAASPKETKSQKLNIYFGHSDRMHKAFRSFVSMGSFVRTFDHRRESNVEIVWQHNQRLILFSRHTRHTDFVQK